MGGLLLRDGNGLSVITAANTHDGAFRALR